MDVYPNLAGLEPECRIGNLHTDTWATVLERYVDNGNPGLQTLFEMSRHEIVHRNLGRKRKKVYMTDSDLLEYYIGCEVRKTGKPAVR